MSSPIESGVAMNAEYRKVILTLASGVEIAATKIMLFSADQVAEASALRVKAAQLMGGVSTGISFWGSPEWAIGGSLVLGAIEAALTKGAAKEGCAALERVHALEQDIKANGHLTPVESIQRIESPHPRQWISEVRRQLLINFSELNKDQRYNLVKKYKIQSSDVGVDDTVTITKSYCLIFDGDIFVNIAREDGRQMAIRWDAVAGYHVSN